MARNPSEQGVLRTGQAGEKSVPRASIKEYRKGLLVPSPVKTGKPDGLLKALTQKGYLILDFIIALVFAHCNKFMPATSKFAPPILGKLIQTGDRECGLSFASLRSRNCLHRTASCALIKSGNLIIF